jgi:hypothetical protein
MLGSGTAMAYCRRTLDLHRAVGSLIGEPLPRTIWATGMRRDAPAFRPVVKRRPAGGV